MGLGRWTVRGVMAVVVILTVGGAARAESLQVVASFSILADLVRQVGGDRVSVISLVGPDGDAHVFEPSPRDALAVKAASLVVVNGLGLEGWLPRFIQATGYKGPVVVASDGVRTRVGDQEHGGLDPHAWQDVTNVRAYVGNIATGLSRADPAHEAIYRAAAAAFTARLDVLDRDVRQAFAPVPASARTVITSHDALGYFGAAYGLTLQAPSGVSTDAEPSAKAVAGLIRQIKRGAVKAIFIENMTDPRLIARIARESGAAVGGRLYSDALSPPEGPASTYEAMIRHNTALIAAALMSSR